MGEELLYSDETYKLIGLCMKVHRELGCGFLEPVYQEAFEMLLKAEGVPYQREKLLPIYFMGQKLTKEYFADFVCYGKIILELLCCAQHNNSYVGLKNMLGSRFAPAKAA